MDNIEEIDKFLEMYNLLRLSQEEMENTSRPIASLKLSKLKKINSQQTKLQDQMALQANSTQHLQKNQHASFWDYSKKLLRKEHSQILSVMPPLPWYQN